MKISLHEYVLRRQIFISYKMARTNTTTPIQLRIKSETLRLYLFKSGPSSFGKKRLLAQSTEFQNDFMDL